MTIFLLNNYIFFYNDYISQKEQNFFFKEYKGTSKLEHLTASSNFIYSILFKLLFKTKLIHI